MWGVQSNQNGIVTNALSTLTMPQYGPANFWIPEDGTQYGMDTNAIKFDMVIGQHALHMMYGRNRMSFKPGKEENFEDGPDEIALRWTQVANRDDIFDIRGEVATAGDFKINNSSAVMVLYSPPGQWS